MPFLAPYCASKFSLEALAYSLKKEMKQLDGINIDIAIIEPGAYATGFNKENNDKKYDWMKNKSYFKYKLDEIRQNEIKKLYPQHPHFGSSFFISQKHLHSQQGLFSSF